jgi:hypothetical protein
LTPEKKEIWDNLNFLGKRFGRPEKNIQTLDSPESFIFIYF